MANTDPSNPDSFPEPNLSVTFRYDGEVDGAAEAQLHVGRLKVEALHGVDGEIECLVGGDGGEAVAEEESSRVECLDVGTLLGDEAME